MAGYIDHLEIEVSMVGPNRMILKALRKFLRAVT